MALSVGSVTVNSATDIQGDGMTFTLFNRRRPPLDASLDAADAQAAAAPRQPDPDKVHAFMQANLLVNGPLVAGYAQSGTWPDTLLLPPSPPADRVMAYRALAADCQALAGGILDHLVDAAEVRPGSMEAGGNPVTGVGRVL